MRSRSLTEKLARINNVNNNRPGPGYRSCLFCCCKVNFTSSGERKSSESEDKAENSISSKFIVSSGHDDDLLEPHIQSVFILRNLLEVSEEKCSEFLLTANDHEHDHPDERQPGPGSWFSVCQNCVQLVRESFEMQKKIATLSREFQNVKDKLKGFICESAGERGNSKRSRFEGRDLVCSQVRESILEEMGKGQEVQGHRGKIKNVSWSDLLTEYDDDRDYEEPTTTAIDDNDDDVEDEEFQEKKPRRRSKVKINPVKRRRLVINRKRKPKVSKADPNSLQCSKCPATFINTQHAESNLLKHLELHETGNGVECNICGRLCENAEKLILHKHRHGQKIDPLERQRLQEISEKVQSQRIPIYCSHCHMIYPKLLPFLLHMRISHGSVSQVPCGFPECNETFLTEQLLNMHRKWVHQEPDVDLCPGRDSEVGNEDEPIKCPHCLETFSSVLDRDFHIAENHLDQLLTCQICNNFRTRRYEALRRHLATHNQADAKKLMCDLCPKSFSSDSGLFYHKRLEHADQLGLTNFLCEQCSLNFPNKPSLNAHMKFVHETARPYCCEFCGKSFKTESCLKKHTLLHTAPRELQYKQGPFYCEHCDYKCNVRQSLFYHMKKIHNDKFQFKCEKCGQGYCSQNKLQYHSSRCKKK